MKEKKTLDHEKLDTIKSFLTSGSNFSINSTPSQHEEKAYQDLIGKISIQNKILSQYKSWANTLVDIISEQEMTDDHLDLGTPIQERLEYIQNLMNENLEIKKKILEQIKINKKLEDKVKIKKWNLNNCVKDYNNENSNSIKDTNNILEKNVQQMANELDNLLELKMELDIIIGNNVQNGFDDLISSSIINFSNHQKIRSKESIFSSRIFQKDDFTEIKKIKELYNNKKNLIEENEILKKIMNEFIPSTIKEKSKIFCGCGGSANYDDEEFNQ